MIFLVAKHYECEENWEDIAQEFSMRDTELPLQTRRNIPALRAKLRKLWFTQLSRDVNSKFTSEEIVIGLISYQRHLAHSEGNFWHLLCQEHLQDKSTE